MSVTITIEHPQVLIDILFGFMLGFVFFYLIPKSWTLVKASLNGREKNE